MTRQQGNRLLLFSLVALAGGVYLGFGLWFAPGWANGWPGLPQREVWPTGLTALAFVVGMCLVIGFGAAILSRVAKRERAANGAFAVWLLCGLTLVAAGCWWVYQELHSTAVQLWP
jgi:hypothetical protein